MNWRWIVPAVVAYAIVSLAMGATAYSSGTWNLRKTAILYGWDAFREVAFVFCPLFAAVLTVGGGLVALAAVWASGGDR